MKFDIWVFRKSIDKNEVLLKSDNYNGHFTWRPIYIYDISIFLGMKDVLYQFISVLNQLDAQNLFHNKFYFMPLLDPSTCARIK